MSSLCIPLMAALMAAAPPPGPDPAAVVPFVGDEVAFVVKVDVATWDVRASIRALLGAAADGENAPDLSRGYVRWVAALKEAGVTDLYVLVDPTTLPEFPVAVVPIVGGADGATIARALTSGADAVPFRWPAAETVRGAVVAGTPEAIARIRGAKPSSRPGLADALAAGGTVPVQVVLIPSVVQRRAIEESMATLPPALGGKPITTLTRGMAWAVLAVEFDPRPSLRAVVRAKDDGSAKALDAFLRRGLAAVADQLRANPATASLAGTLAEIEPAVEGDRITFRIDPSRALALIALPIGQAREAARRSQCVNNLKQIGLAMHNYHSSHNTFPPAHGATGDGKPLLSWRVYILPYLEQQPLFAEFHLDEPWDSPHNKALIPRMPPVYACPSRGEAPAGKTTYLTPRGPSTIFAGAQGVKIQEITDGTSNTLLVVDAGDDKAVTWTKPDDWEVGPNPDAGALVGHHPGGFEALFGDGSVRFFKESIASAVLKALTTRDGGEVIGADDF